MSVKYTKKSVKSEVKKNLGYLQPEVLAKEMKLVQRKERKFTTSDLLLSFWQTLVLGVFSYNNLASKVSAQSKSKSVSAQAVWKRLKAKKFNSYVKKLVQKSLKKRCDAFIESKLFKAFPNVYVQDATHYKLAEHLAKQFPGSYSKTGKNATAKIQAVFNLTKGVFVNFKLCSFRNNDQSDAPRFIRKMKKGELIIRDLGYSVLASFERISHKKCYFLSRFKYNLTVYHLSDNEKIDLEKMLEKRGKLDMWVRLGAKNKVKCRLIAVPLPDQVVNERRRKANKNRNSKSNHSKKYLELLGYSIYITNVEEDIWSAKEIMEAYRCRWYIEILFKGWKSHLKLAINIPDRYITKQRIELFFYMAFLMLTLVVMPIFTLLQKRVKNKERTVSILKLCTFIRENMEAFISEKKCSHILKKAEYYCLYDKRKKHLNSIERIFFYQP